jgi:hypothetical protein
MVFCTKKNLATLYRMHRQRMNYNSPDLKISESLSPTHPYRNWVARAEVGLHKYFNVRKNQLQEEASLTNAQVTCRHYSHKAICVRVARFFLARYTNKLLKP